MIESEIHLDTVIWDMMDDCNQKDGVKLGRSYDQLSRNKGKQRADYSEVLSSQGNAERVNWK